MKKKITGALMILFTLTVLIIWELWGEEYFMYSDIAVLKEDVGEDTIITENMIKTVRVEKPNERFLTAGDIDSIIGMQSKQYIMCNEGLIPEYFEEQKYLYGENTKFSVLAIPSDWLMTTPQSIKRGDRAFFYAYGKLVSACRVIHVKDEDNREIQYSDEERSNASGSISLIDVIVTKEQIRKLSEVVNGGGKLLITYK